MRYQRLHIRVPASGEVILSAAEGIKVEASVINVSAGGLCITAPSYLIEHDEYHVEVITPDHGKIHFSGLPVYQTEESIGIKITSIEKDQLNIIYQIIGSFQLTDEFIKYIGERDIIHDWLVDESGEAVEITFDTEPNRENER